MSVLVFMTVIRLYQDYTLIILLLNVKNVIIPVKHVLLLLLVFLVDSDLKEEK